MTKALKILRSGLKDYSPLWLLYFQATPFTFINI